MEKQIVSPFGYPAFWPIAHETFHRSFVGLNRINEDLGWFLTTNFQDQEPYKVVIRHGAAIAAACLCELMTLVGNGQGTGAWKITRALLELTINLEYLRVDKTDRQNYLDWHWVERHRLRKFFSKRPSLAAVIDAKEAAIEEEEFKKVASRFRTKKGKLRANWASFDLATRARKANLFEFYDGIYAMTSELMHSSIGGMASYFIGEELIIPPHRVHCDDALRFGHACLVQIVQTISLTLNAAPAIPIEQLKKELAESWPEIMPDITSRKD